MKLSESFQFISKVPLRAADSFIEGQGDDGSCNSFRLVQLKVARIPGREFRLAIGLQSSLPNASCDWEFKEKKCEFERRVFR
jgi:hypothetical protein